MIGETMSMAEGISEKTIETINDKLKESRDSSIRAYIDYYDDDENVVEVRFLSAEDKARPENIEAYGTEDADFNKTLINLVETLSPYRLSGIRLLFNDIHDAKYVKILTENNFFYEITDYIFEIDGTYAIMVYEGEDSNPIKSLYETLKKN